MSNITRKISFPFVLLILLFIKDSISLESKNQDQAFQLKKTLETSKSLEIAPDYGKLPLYFIPNEGQVDEKALFYAKASKYILWLTKEGLIFDSTKKMKKENAESLISNPRYANNPESFAFGRDVSRLLFLKSKKNPEVVPVDRTEHRVNYFMGKDKSKWRTNIQTSTAVLYKELYRNIDLKIYGNEKQIEYDFVVRPGGEAKNISFEYRGVEKTEIDIEGNLVIKTEFGEIKHAKPICYQVIGEERVEVGANFEKITNNTYGFMVKEYNKNYELIIDPLILVYSTYLGGSRSDFSHDIAVDSEGVAYVTGYTDSTDFPTKNPFQGSFAGEGDVFITKIDSSGNSLIYSTYLGGSRHDIANGMALDSQGAVYVTGYTGSTDFPVKNPFQESYAGGYSEAFITKINSSGNALVYSTYLGGSSLDCGLPLGCDIAIDSEGTAYVTGFTSSDDFPTQNPFQEIHANGWSDVFITKLCLAYSLTITAGTGGTTDPSPGIYTYCSGTEVIIEATPDAHYRFSHWSGDISETANPPSGKYTYDPRTRVAKRAILNTHSRFTGVRGDVSSADNPITIAIDSDKSIKANFVRIIYPPLNFAGQKVLNRSLSQAEYINILTWRPNPNNVQVMKYRVYILDGENKILLIELNFYTFKYWHRRVEKNKPYTYVICAVNDEDREGDFVQVIVQ